MSDPLDTPESELQLAYLRWMSGGSAEDMWPKAREALHKHEEIELRRSVAAGDAVRIQKAKEQ